MPGTVTGCGIPCGMDLDARTDADGVVTEQHIVTLIRADGFSASADVCAVIRFDENMFVTRIDECFDSVAFGPLLS